MGCFPTKIKKLTIVSVISGFDESTKKGNLQAGNSRSNIAENLKFSSKKVQSLNDFKLAQGIMIFDSGSDPSLHYEKLKIMGEGSFGTVFMVCHRQTGLIRAMKVIDKKSASLDAASENSLINEINILKSLDHPNILKVFEYFNTKTKLFIITELCTGGELFKKLTNEKCFSEKIAAHIMKQVFSAVTFCHRNKIIHRDLKPENILIESEKEATKELFHIKVIDFGTSEAIKKNQMLTMQIGTPYYIAPEILKGSYNEKCDLWSCGVIMYILLSGKPPFWAEEDEEIYRLVQLGKFQMPKAEWENISNEAKELIKSLLVKDISKRCSAEQALAHPWFRKMAQQKEKFMQAKLSEVNLISVARNLKSYNADKKLQQATLAYIVHNMLKKEETEEFRKIFTEFDANGDGRLTREELISGLNKVMKPKEAEAEVDRIFNIVDVDGNGFIEYEEFLRGAMNKERILTEHNLKIVFDLFDKDKSGKISIEEIRQMLGGKNEIGNKDGETAANEVNESVWAQMLKEMDNDGDGEIEFWEFKNMMDKLVGLKEEHLIN